MADGRDSAQPLEVDGASGRGCWGGRRSGLAVVALSAVRCDCDIRAHEHVDGNPDTPRVVCRAEQPERTPHEHAVAMSAITNLTTSERQ